MDRDGVVDNKAGMMFLSSKELSIMSGRLEQAIGSGGETISPLGATLRSWRHYRGFSAAELARRAGWNENARSLISRVEHGRISSLSSAYLEQLATALGIEKNTLTEYKLPPRRRTPAVSPERLLASAENIPIGSDWAKVIADLLGERLSPRLQETIWDAFRTYQMDKPSEEIRETAPQIGPSEQPSDDMRLLDPPEPVPLRQVLSGANDIARAAIQLVQSAQGPSPDLSLSLSTLSSDTSLTRRPSDRQIIITWQGNLNILKHARDLRKEWDSALRQAVDRGWDVVHLIGFTSTWLTRPDEIALRGEKARAIVHYMMLLLGAKGLYRPHLVNMGEWGNDEHIYVPSIGLLRLKDQTKDKDYRASLSLSDPRDKERQLVRELKQLAATGRSVYFCRFTRIEFSERIAEVEEASGDRYLAMDGLSECSVPLELYARRVERLKARLTSMPSKAQKGEKMPSKAQRAELQVLLEASWKNRQRREDALKSNLNQGRWVRDMTTIDAIVRLVTEGIFSRDDILLYIGNKLGVDMRLTIQERIQVLEHVANRLREKERYELFFATLGNQPLSLIKRGDKGGWLLIESLPSGKGVQDGEGEWDIEVVEPEIVTAFRQTSAWRTALDRSKADRDGAQKHTHKERCIKYLEAQIKLLEHSDKTESPTKAPLPDLQEAQKERAV
jgi:transcriptional regulator with XRE-family HTH domain